MFIEINYVLLRASRFQQNYGSHSSQVHIFTTKQELTLLITFLW